MQEEGISQVGAFVALCNVDEENILLSVFAKDTGCGKLVTKINRIDYENVINRLELDTTVCPRVITADTILQFVRSMENSKGSNMETLYNIIPGKVEAASFIVRENSPVTGKPLSKLRFKKDVLIASITRGDEVIVPRGQDVIQTGDNVVVVSKQLALYDIADVLK